VDDALAVDHDFDLVGFKTALPHLVLQLLLHFPQSFLQRIARFTHFVAHVCLILHPILPWLYRMDRVVSGRVDECKFTGAHLLR
jgi:hypothetical protein